ncbi:synaptobrevin, Longin-like domain protein [Artemisia annua]|uniref:Synaptobrevin, Longin-like domain protein n=1 Tax=Artemisia annua TaxID=35608 RepID=A0A2U1L9V7_ARTAN|nr:synaptobrevin, Longin-like domain protein [Artemisia annua]
METLVKSCDREDLDTLWKLVQLDFKNGGKADVKAQELYVDLQRMFAPSSADVHWSFPSQDKPSYGSYILQVEFIIYLSMEVLISLCSLMWCILKALKYALTCHPIIYDSLVKQFWQTATAETLADGTQELRATIDNTDYSVTESSIRSSLQLNDASGITMLSNKKIFKGIKKMGYLPDGTFTFWNSQFTPNWRFLIHHLLQCLSCKSGGWDQFGSNLASALICLSTNKTYVFSKMIFEAMVTNSKSTTKFLMYPRFLQTVLDVETTNKLQYIFIPFKKKVFANMKRSF